jgi:FkbM family methyltransferase
MFRSVARRGVSLVKTAVMMRGVLVGARSLVRFRRLRHLETAPRDDSTPTAVRVRALGRRWVWLRPGTTDVSVLVDTFVGGYHLPPATVDLPSAPVIWDLGANIGLTAAHFAQLYPTARVLGVELDAGNAALARTNTRPWSDRCELVHAGVWIEDGTISYHRGAQGEWGYRIAATLASEPDPDTSAPALSLNALLRREPNGRVDYLKMDIEGSEDRVLSEHTDWAASVGAIKVEVHAPYSIDRCLSDLRGLGFTATVDARHHACVVGTRHLAQPRADGRGPDVELAPA